MLWEHRSFTFTADDVSTTLEFASLETAIGDNAMIADIQVIEIPAAVTTILNNDPTLQYDAATGKFYRLVDTQTSWTSADSAARTAQLNGVGGQLVTIRSDYENTLIRSLQLAMGLPQDIWLGATDLTSEGDFYWRDGSVDDDQFWTGGLAGSGIGYSNFGAGNPNNGGGNEDYVELKANSSTGTWIDIYNAGDLGGNAYVIEWDASEVLSNFTFSLTDDAGGRFAIDSSTGEVTVADGSLIDFEAATSHNIDVQVTDAAGNSYNEVMSIAIDNELDANQTVPAAQTIAEDGTLTFINGTATEVSVNDSFAGTNSPMRVTLSVNDGVLNLSGTTGITFVEGANGSSAFVIDGTESHINAALNNMTFTPTDNFNGSVSLNMTTALAADLDGRYEFEGNANDTSNGTNNPGTLVGATTTPDATRGGEVLLLDAAGEHVEIAGRFNTPTDATLAAWVNLDAGIADAEIISLGNNLFLRADAVGSGLALGYYQGSGVWNFVNATGVNLDGEGWSHVAATFDDTNNLVTVFLNGQEVASLSTTDSIDWTHDANTSLVTTIGAHGNGAAFDFRGLIDDARVYTRALSADEIAALAADQTEASDSVAITVDPVNDAPVVSGPPSAYSATEQTNLSIHGTGFSVSDVDAASGNVTATVAVGEGTISISVGDSGVAITSGNGTGSVVIQGNVSEINNLLTDGGTGTITYVNASDAPAASTTITITVNDEGNTGTDPGLTGDGTSEEGSASQTINITGVNDAPTLDNSGAPTMTSITEDDVNNGGMTVAALLATGAGADPISDVDGDPEGIAITARVNGRGQWQYSVNGGTNWSNVGTVSETQALLLSATDLVRFNPDGQNGTVKTFDFRAWDQSSGTPGDKVDTSTNGGATAFSTAIETASITTTDVNDAPVLDNSGTINLNAQAEDSGAPSGAVGTAITDFITNGGNVTDVDASSQAGIAITDADATNGTWWYSLDSGSNWNALGAVSETSARVLNASSITRLYFEPNADFNGTIADAITFHAWDQTSGSNGSVADLSDNAVSDQFSTVSYSNNDGTTNWASDWIEVDADGGGASGGRILVRPAGDLEIRARNVNDNISREVDLSGATSAILSFDYNNLLGSGDVIVVQASNNGGSSYTTLSGGTFSSSLNTGSGTFSLDISSFIAADTNIRFYISGAGDENDLLIDNVQITSPSGNTGGSSAFSIDSDSASLTVTAVNDVPTIINLSGDTLNYNEGDGAVVVEQGANAVISDIDGGDFNTGTLTISIASGGDAAEDVLAIRNQGTSAGQVGISGSDVSFGGTTVGSFTGGTGGTDLVVTFNASSTPLAATMILQNITYENTDTTAPTTGARTVEFEVTDGDGGTSLTHSTTVNVAAANDPATVAVNTGITVAEGGSVVIGTANLNEGDPDDDGADVIYRARIDINGGSLFLNGTVLEQNDTFTQADIDAGRISYVHAGGEDATEVIRLAINDVGNSGETNFQIAVAVTGQNDAPAAADDPVGTFDPVTDLDTIGFWRLGESSGTTAVDAAGSNNGTYNNVTMGAAGAITGDTAADFNGIDSHVNLGALEVSGSGITMAAWINGDDFGTADGRIISKAEGATNADHSWMLSVFDVGADTYMRLRISAGNHTELLIAQAPSLNIGQWYHVAGTYDQATGEMAIYVDGDLVEFGAHSVGGAVDQDPSRDVWIGGNPVSGSYFDGRIDEALIVERALAAGEIAALSDQTPPDYSVAENSTLSINAANGVLRNDSDVEGDALTVSEVNGVGASVGNQITLASGALLTVNADGSFDYDPNGQFESLGVGQTGTDSFTYTLSDGTATDSASVVVNITGANDAAVITNLDGDALLYNAGTGAVVLDQGSASVATDIDSANLATGSLTVSLTGAVPAEDVFSIVNEGTAAGEIGFDGSNVTYGGVQFGTATGGSGGTDLVISFDTNATLNAVSALLNNITYENTGGATPTTGARLANFVIDDGDGGVSATTGVSINVVSTATAVIRDEFNAVSYSNNDGTVNWSNSWTELGESTSPTAGNVEVDAAQDAVEIGSGPTLLLFATDITGLGIQRTADLSNAHDAVLSLDAWKSGVGSGDVSVQVSTNGSTWTTLANLDFSSLSTSRTNLEYDISSHMSATTSIRVVGSGTVGGVLQSGYYWLDNISINYTPNTAPVVSLSGGSASFTENGGAISIDGSATVFDAESPDFDGGTLTVDFTAGATSNDRLGIEDQGTGVGQIGVSGSTVSFEGTTIGTFAGGSDGSTPLVITLDSSADSAAAQALARSITFDNVSENPSATTRTARFVLTDGDGGTSTAVTRTISVSDINDAPVLDNTPAPSLTAITEDEIGGGMTVAAILATGGGGDPITDVDGDPEGIAIIGRSGVNGTWEYSFDGTNWSNVGNVNPSNARLLRATDFVRFSPDGTNGASNSFVFRAWDQSTGTAGQLVDASSTGGSTAFSTAGATASINVTDVNDAPVLDNSGALNLATQAEDSGAPVGAVGTVITDIVQLGGNVTDIDTSSQPGIAVTAADTTNGTWWYTIDGGTNWNALGAVSDSSARVLNANSNTRIYFEPNANFNGTISNALTFRAWDRSAGTSGSLQNASVNGGTTAFSTASETADLSITAGNDAPVLTAPGGSVNLTENAGITPFNAESFTDIDSADLNSGSLTFTVTSTPNASDDTLTLSTMGGIVNITGGVNVFVSGTQVGTVSGLDTSGPLTISFNANSTPASAETLLQAFFIRNLSDDPTPGTRTIEVVATDGDGGTSAAVSADVEFLAVNDAPTITNLNGDTLNYTEGDGAVVVEQGGNAIISDVDSANFDTGTLTVAFSAGSDPLEDVLAIRNQGTGAGQVGVSGSDVTFGGTVIGSFTGGSLGTDLVVTFDANATSVGVTMVMQNVTYENTDLLTPTAGPRTVDFTVTDGDGGSSPTQSTTINVAGSNDAPTISAIGNQTINEDGTTGPLAFSVADAETSAGSLTVTALSNNTTIIPNGNLTLVNLGSGSWTIEAAPALNQNGGPVTITVTVDDGTTTTDTTFDVTVTAQNDAPTISAIGDQTIAEDNTTGALAFTVGDVETAAGTLTVSAVSSNQTIIPDGNLSLVDLGGGNWTIEAAPDLNQNGGPVTITVTVDDGSTTTDTTFDVTVTAVNDVPVFAFNQMTISDGESLVLSSTELSATDVETADSSLVFTVSSVTNGQFEHVTAPQTAITSFTQAQILAGEIVFVHDGSGAAPAYQVSIFDGTANTAPAAASISFTAVNDAPVITALGGDGITVFNDGTPVGIDANAAAAVFDIDLPPDYDGGFLSVTGNSFDGADTLGLDTSGAISLSAGWSTGSLVSVSGTNVGTILTASNSGVVITFNSNSTVAAVDLILQSLTFESTSSTLGLRSVDLVFNDGDGTANGGDDTSETATVQIAVAQAGTGLVSTNEDTTHTFSASDFDFTGIVGSNLNSITITTLPANGSLRLAGVPITTPQSVTRAEIDAGDLTFVPVADENGPAYGSFDFFVNDGKASVGVLGGEPNSFTIGGGALVPTDDILSNSANFGPGGTYSAGVSIIGQSSVIDAGYLSQGDILFNGFVRDGAWTASELTAVDTWVQAGGILISTSDAATYDDVSAFYGLTVGGAGSTSWLVDDASSPIMNGPFGLVGPNGSSFEATGAIGYFTTASLDPSDQVLATDSVTGEPTIVLRQHGSGWILFTADEGIFRADMTGGGTVATANDRLAANVFAWAADQVGTSQSFSVNVAVVAVNDAPAISAIGDQTIDEDSSTGPLAFAVGDIDNLTASLSVTATSSDLSIIPNTNLTLTDLGGGNWTIDVAPLPNQNGGPVTVTVTVDDGSTTTSTTFDVTINAVNDAPIVTVPATQTITEDTQTAIVGISIGDVDDAGLPLAVHLDVTNGSIVLDLSGGATVTSGANNSALVRLSGTKTQLNAALASLEYRPDLNVEGIAADALTVLVSDLGNSGSGGVLIDSDTVQIDIVNVNDEEIIATNAGLTVLEGQTAGAITQAMLETTDIESTPDLVVYTVDSIPTTGTLRLNGTALAILDTFTQQDINNGLLTYDHNDAEVFVDDFDFTVDDGTGTATSATFAITIVPVNDNDPTITSHAGAASVSLTIDENQTAVTTITATDSDLPAQTLTFSIAGGADAGRFSIDPSTGALSFAVAPDFESPSDSGIDNGYDVVIEVDDGLGRTDQQTIHVDVLDIDEFDASAIVDNDAAANQVDENVAAGTTVGITAFSEDLDGTDNGITYSLDDDASGLFTIDSSTGVVTTAAAIDFESTGPTLNVTVRATSDDSSSTTQAFSITINDLDEFDATPIADINATAENIDENVTVGTAVGITAFSEDLDGTTNTITYSLDNDAGGLFAINSATGVVTTNSAIDYEVVGPTHLITVRATSADTSTVTRDFTITVNDLDEFDVTPIVDNDAATNQVDENVAAGTTVGITAFSEDLDGTDNGITYSLDDDASGLFTIDSSTGVVTTAAAIDFESTGPTLNVTVRATSEDDSSTTQSYGITVNDLSDNAPVITAGQSFTVNEFSGNGTSIGNVLATDADTVGFLQNWTITGGNVDGIFAVNLATGELTVTDDSNLNYESNNSYTLTLTVDDGFSTSATQTVQVDVVDQNDAPVFTPAAVLDVDENSGNGTAVGFVFASDEDIADVLTYRFVGGPGLAFRIDSSTGLISVADVTQLDFESTTSFTLTVEVEDPGNLTDVQSITINVNDLNEHPVDLTLAGSVVAENSASGTFIGIVSGADVDAGDSLTYSFTDSADGRFAVDAVSGVISVANGSLLDFESNTSHSVTVRTTDSGGLTYDESFTITVTDVNEAPTAGNDTFTGDQLEDLVVEPGEVVANDFDVDGDAITVILVDGPQNGTVVLNADGSFTYTPEGSFSGMDSFTYLVSDGLLTSNTATVELEIRTTVSGSSATEPEDTKPAESSSERETGKEDPADQESETDDTDANNDNVTKNSTDVVRLAEGPAGEESETLVAGGAQDASEQIITSTSSQQFVAIFLDDIPESGDVRNDNVRKQERDRKDEETSVTSGNFLFAPLTAERPFLASLDLQLEEQTFVHEQERDAFDEVVLEKVVVGSTAAVSTSVSVGYVVWMLRGGSLLTTFLSSLPAWQAFDPLPVLESFGEESAEDEESLESIVSG